MMRQWLHCSFWGQGSTRSPVPKCSEELAGAASRAHTLVCWVLGWHSGSWICCCGCCWRSKHASPAGARGQGPCRVENCITYWSDPAFYLHLILGSRPRISAFLMGPAPG
eukprot:1142942-Pelagomonas_calceolata.AAC.7